MPNFTASLLFAAASLLQAQPADQAARLTEHLQKWKQIHVDFAQTRTLAALSKPLKTTGRLVAVKDQGVIWQVKKPLSLTYVIGPKGMLEVGPDGKATRRSAKDAPMIAEMGLIFEALLQGQWHPLEGHYAVQTEGKPERWKIQLIPRERSANAIKEVLISGTAFIERIHVEEPSGDGMDLDFDHPDLNTFLSGDEQHLLEE